ncbi:response regulator transcription factor [Treponema sp.]|uniref:response regulator transcription factor n=1 Tax=Treponema sp. TaxID=166 RepID=UPI003FA2CCAA
MTSLKTLIVDDEEIIRKGLRSLLSNDPQIDVVGEAGDGERAFEMIAQTKYDLVFMDINMPFLNGLGCIDKLREIGENPLVIIVSGYDDFNYAKQAISLGVFDYILKPVMEETLVEVVEKAKKELLNRKKSHSYLTWAKSQLEKNRDFLIEDFMRNLLKQCYDDIEIKSRIECLNLPEYTELSFFLLRFSFSENSAFSLADWNENLVFYAAKELAYRVFVDYPHIISFQISDFDMGIICRALSAAEQALLSDVLKSELEKCIPVHMRILCGNAAGYESLADLYDGLKERLADSVPVPALVLDALAYMNTRYTDNLFSLQDAADFLHITPQHLSRLFKSALGETFVEHLTMLRLHKALELLKRSDARIYEIAEQAGYSSQHYFCTSFKRALHISPQEYRRLFFKGGKNQ